MEEPKRPFRRKRRFQGATWTPENQPALKPDGAWCKACKTRHGYMTMGIAYEKRKSGWIILWSCKKTGNVIEEMELGQK